jgi:acyl-CoA synthetase (AMP-forming)/AMP-acid ligase II
MSESGFVLLVPVSQSRDLKERETVGRVAPGCHIKVIDAEGRPLPSNTIGEICIKGDQVSPGYLKSRENQRLFTSDGFLRSGDLGYYDNQAFFFITARAKEIMKIDGQSHDSHMSLFIDYYLVFQELLSLPQSWNTYFWPIKTWKWRL